MAVSNTLRHSFWTLDYIDSLVASGETATTIDIDYNANIDSGTVYWAVWDNGTVPADSAAVQAHVGAVDFGSATISATGAQTTITPTVADTADQAYGFYLVWDDTTNESLLLSETFGTAFSITDVDLDDDIYNGQTNVEINCINAGTTEGIVEYGGIVQSGITWTNTKITIAALDSGALVLGDYEMIVYKPIP